MLKQLDVVDAHVFIKEYDVVGHDGTECSKGTIYETLFTQFPSAP